MEVKNSEGTFPATVPKLKYNWRKKVFIQTTLAFNLELLFHLLFVTYSFGQKTDHVAMCI